VAGTRLHTWSILLIGLLICGTIALQACGQKTPTDRTLVLHYTFDRDTGEVAKDLSGYGNDGKIVGAEYLKKLDGRRGVLRFDGEKAVLECPNSDSLFFDGDMTFEMWVRQNGLPKDVWATLFGDNDNFAFYRVYWYQLVLWYNYRDPVHDNESVDLPVDRNILGEEWSHIAVVFEYPRCRFYHNGKLVRDAFMPIPGIVNRYRVAKVIGKKSPIDLDEFRLYRRALTAEEVAAHARGEEAPPQQSHELAVEPYWYEDRVALRLSCKGINYSGYRAELALNRPDGAQIAEPKTVFLKEAFRNCGRYVAEVSFPLSELAGKTVEGVARLLKADGTAVKTVTQRADLTKPEWVHTREGYSDDVPPPWTPVEAEKKPDGAVEVRVWGRRYDFGPALLPQGIETRESQVLASPAALKARANGRAIAWEDGRVSLKEVSRTTANLEGAARGGGLAVRASGTIEYDGYALFEYRVEAQRTVSLERLTLDIPLKTRHAKLCYGDRVLPKNPKIPIAEWYSGAVKGDLAFRFSPLIWLGDQDRGLCWQAESDEYWRNSDRQKAIEILPRGEVTVFRAHLVDVPIRLAKGQALHYKFALAATPFKPLLRDSWDLRIARSEPYGRDLEIPEQKTGGKPTLQYYAKAGIRHLFINVNDIWPYPVPVHKKFSDALHRLVRETHAHGLRLYCYMIHERFPTMAPEFDLNGLHMAQRPMRQYIPGGNPPGNPRPGPVTHAFGADSQGTVFFCPKSKALQDACIHSLAKRLEIYGEDGVYLDGTAQTPPCANLLHGCGYRAPDGTLRKTYPVFGVREFMKRIYTVVKQGKPEGVVDVHCSWGYNPPGLAYADVLWSGEQWWHLRRTGAPGGYVAGQLTLDKFQTEFMGRQLGVAAETLAYRLGPQMKVAATSLLHDIPVRPSTPGFSEAPRKPSPTSYFDLMVKLWKVRDEFGAKEAEKLFYWENQDYVQVSPEKCYSTLFKHPENGVLAFLTNLRRDAATMEVRFNLDKLGLAGRPLKVFDVLTGKPIKMTSDGKVSVRLGSEEWTYIWLRPAK